MKRRKATLVVQKQQQEVEQLIQLHYIAVHQYIVNNAVLSCSKIKYKLSKLEQ